ncbi:MAG: hypothetical protein NVS2B14_04700 [Chamaesiphon sp.]
MLLRTGQGKQYYGCLFGDSISSTLGNSLGKHNINFARAGMSTSSLIEQMRSLTHSHVKCQKAIIAIGTNDAKYKVSNYIFIKRMTNTIRLLRSMGTQNIFLIPAFYSTISASHNPHLAGTITQVETINKLIRQVAVKENVAMESSIVRFLSRGRALKEELTSDGVHLNNKGRYMYKQAIINIFNVY